MIRKMDRQITILLATFFFIVYIPSNSIAASNVLPPNWPWRGVVIDSMTPPDAKDMRYLQEIGVNAVNIHLRPRDAARRKKISGREALEKDLQWVNEFLNECKRHGITAVISIGQIPLDPAAGLAQTSAGFWDNPELLKEAVYVAGELARRFKGRGRELGAYSILSEPVVLRDKTFLGFKYGVRSEKPQAWPNLMKDIVKEIRKYDKTRFISVTPGLWGLPAGYAGFIPLDDPYIIYEAHMYDPHAFTHQGIAGGSSAGLMYPGGLRWWSFTFWDADRLRGALGPLIRFKKRYKVPVWIGEFSAVRWAEGWDGYLKDLVNIFDSNGFAWTYHCFKCWHGWNPDYAREGSTGDSANWRLDYRGRDTMRWRLLKAAFEKNKIRENIKTGKTSR